MKQWTALWVMGWLGLSVAAAQDYGDVPYVQTPQPVVDRMLEVAKVTGKDFLIDLGSGDGRMIITAARRYGTHGFGVDLDKRLVDLANHNAAKAGLADHAVFYERDLHETDLSKADVITIYLLPEVNLMVRPHVLALKPGTRLVSHDYGFGEWPPDLELTVDAPGKPVGRDKTSKILYYVVPSQVAGKWVWKDGDNGDNSAFELQLDQAFQKISGTVSRGGKTVAIENPRLSGYDISFEAAFGPGVRYTFSGKAVNNAIKGTLSNLSAGGSRRIWNATRVEQREARFTDLVPGVMAR